MQTIVRTIYGAYIQTCQLLGLPLTIKEHTTLNEKFNIHSEVMLANTDIPRMKYVCIGNGGHKTIIGADGIAKIEPIQHMPRNAALYNHMPFVLRQPNNDLNAAERMNYRLRRLEFHDEKPYIAYYGKALNLNDTIPQMDLKSVVDGVTYTTPFDPNNGDLNPTPPDLSNTGVNLTTGDYIFCSAKVPFEMTAQEVEEYLNVANIIYGDEAYAMISEIALCTGVDRSVMGDFNGVSSAYVDAIGVQVANFVSAFYAMQFNNNGINMLLNVGSVEPLLTTIPSE